MQAEHINPFITGFQTVSQEVAGIAFQTTHKALKQTPLSSKNVIVMLGVTGDLRGNVAININEEGAMKIASNMMGGLPVETFDDIAKSAVSELGNMIMGRVCTILSQQNLVIDITPPSLLTGENIQLSFAKLPLLSVSFSYENIEVDFDISVHPR